MEFKGTKGNWSVEYNNSFESEIKCGKIRIAEAKHYNNGKEDWAINDPEKKEGMFNAKLISKAPEMLEMLKRSIEEIKHLKETYKDVGHAGKYLFQCEQLMKEATTI